VKDIILKDIEASIAVKTALLQDPATHEKIIEVVNAIVQAFRNNKRVYFCGNGGSAADAQHLSAELSGRFYLNREALPSEALHCNTSYLTAVANDYDFDVIYARLLHGLAHEGDVVIGLSTSGNSKNIVQAFQVARDKKVLTIGLTGAAGGKLAELSDWLFNVPSTDTPRIQESHIMIGHIICELVEAEYFSSVTKP
jgi:D-sedoheptulose 7-phosphate isomerase